jgi:selenide, water dikinase
VIRIAGDIAIAQTVDFFTPIVDDPYVFGQIAATNSISDIYAMGATPILGLAIAGFPTDKLPLDVLEAILRGGADKAIEAGFSVAGGHTIIDDVPKYGLVVTGVVTVDKLIRNSTGRAGDVLYLTKPIGTGILVSANRVKKLFHKKPPLDEAIRWMTTLNRDAANAMSDCGASAATDVTGYGFIGHLLEICEGSGVGATISAGAIPVLKGAREELARGFRPEGTMRNVSAFRGRVRLNVPESELTLLCDAQTSGGLLIAISPERSGALEARFRESGLFYAKVGELTADTGRITLTK